LLKHYLSLFHIYIDFNKQLNLQKMEAINNIYQHNNRLMNFAMSLTLNRNDAQDLVQETYLKALLNREKFTDDKNLFGWLSTILKNSFINEYKKKKRYQLSDDVSMNGAVTGSNAEVSVSVNELEKSIDLLEDDHKTTFKLFTSGYKYKEISDITKVPVGTVKSRIFFSRKKLSEMLVAYGRN